MRYWVEEMHVDGFRFDLASVLARNDDGSLNWEDPIDLASARPRMDVRFIAEPWDAAGAYQLGRSFPAKRCFQWNGRFRDDVRRFVRGDPGMVPALMQRLYGSDDLFPDDRMHAFHPYQSVNYVTCPRRLHPVRPRLVRPETQPGQRPQQHGRPGRELQLELRLGRGRRSPGARAGAAQAAGEELLLPAAAGERDADVPRGRRVPADPGRQQQPVQPGQRDELARLGPAPRPPGRVSVLPLDDRFRKAHPSLGRSRFWRDDVRWYGTGPTVDMGPDSHTLAFYLCGASQQDADLYVMINASESDMTFEIQEGRPGEWRLAFDTGLVSPDDFPELPETTGIRSSSYVVRARSIAGLTRDALMPQGANP